MEIFYRTEHLKFLSNFLRFVRPVQGKSGRPNARNIRGRKFDFNPFCCIMMRFRTLVRQAAASQRHASLLSRASHPGFDSISTSNGAVRMLNTKSPSTSELNENNPAQSTGSRAEATDSTRQGHSPFEVDNAAFHNYTIHDLMNARVHMGHRKHLWHPHMAPFILGHRNGMSIINLDKTIPLLRRALTATSLMAENDCTFLWLGPRDVQKNKIIEREAKKAGAFTIDGARWIGGTLTNPIKSNQAQRFNYRIPDCIFVLDVLRHAPALHEARLVGIPSIGIVDSDCDPRMLTYPIPGNDDNALAIYLYCSLMKFAIQDGRARGRRLNRPSFQLPSLSPGSSR